MPSSKQPQDHRPKKGNKQKRQQASTPQPIPVPDDPNDKYAADSWVSGGVGGTQDLRVPSGQLCLVRRPGLEGLMKAGVLRNMDSLSAIVSDEHLKRVKGKGGAVEEEVDALSLMNDPEALGNIMHVVDRVICHVVVKPQIHMTPNDVTRRVPGVVYTDMVDLVDKMFIFNFVVGGTRDLDSFREGSGDAVGGLEDLEGVPATAE